MMQPADAAFIQVWKKYTEFKLAIAEEEQPQDKAIVEEIFWKFVVEALFYMCSMHKQLNQGEERKDSIGC